MNDKKYEIWHEGTPVKDSLGLTVSYLWHIIEDGLMSRHAGEGLTLGEARRDALNQIRELENL